MNLQSDITAMELDEYIKVFFMNLEWGITKMESNLIKMYSVWLYYSKLV